MTKMADVIKQDFAEVGHATCPGPEMGALMNSWIDVMISCLVGRMSRNANPIQVIGRTISLE